MKLSIIIPAYNVEKYIKDCINSLLLEIDDRKDIEIIVVNDGSKDDTAKILKSIKSDIIRLYNNNNYGVSYTRNFGISKARGKYLMFVDSDDLLNKHWLNKIDEIISANDDFAVISNNFDGEEYTNLDMIKACIRSSNNSLKNCYLSSVCSKIYKKSFIKEHNIKFNEKIINGEDMLFNLNVLLKSKNVTLYKFNLYKYRINSTSSTQTFNEKIFSSDKLFHKYLSNLLSDSILNNEEKKEIINYSIENAIRIISYKISKLKKYSEAKNYFKLLEQKPYSDVIKKKKEGLDLVLKLYKTKNYMMIYGYYKLRDGLKKLIRKKEYYIEV